MTNFAAFTILMVYVAVATFFHLSHTPPMTIGIVSALLNGAIALYLFDSGSMGCTATGVGCFNVYAVISVGALLVKSSPSLAGLLADKTVFDQLRVDPFYRRILSVHPDLDGPLAKVAEEV